MKSFEPNGVDYEDSIWEYVDAVIDRRDKLKKERDSRIIKGLCKLLEPEIEIK